MTKVCWSRGSEESEKRKRTTASSAAIAAPSRGHTSCMLASEPLTPRNSSMSTREHHRRCRANGVQAEIEGVCLQQEADKRRAHRRQAEGEHRWENGSEMVRRT
jgi:hypothetical protein